MPQFDAAGLWTIKEEKMPIYEYKCTHCGGVFEKFYKTFSEADNKKEAARCPNCPPLVDTDGTEWYRLGKRVVSVPMPAHLYGREEGYHKPSPTKRHSWKLAAKDGNSGSMG